MAGVEIDVAPDPASEALRIALRLREALSVPDRKAVADHAEPQPRPPGGGRAARWGVVLDDSAGLPLDQTPPGGFLLLTALLAAPDASPVDLLAALKHPLAAGGMRARGISGAWSAAWTAWSCAGRGRGRWLGGLAEALAEVEDAADLRAWLARDRHGRGCRSRARSMAGEHCRWRRSWSRCISPSPSGSRRTRAATRASCGHARPAARAREFMTGLAEAADAAGEHTVRPPIRRMLAILMASVNVRPDRPAHPRLAVLGQIEGRLVDADLVILGGLNEGIWPPAPESGPWLNRAMRAGLGLPPAEQAIGIAAHDFLAAAGAPRGGAQPGRQGRERDTHGGVALARAAAGAAVRDRHRQPPRAGDRRLGQRSSISRTGRRARSRGREPRPPLAARPRELWVSDIERLMRDPYAVYASRILSLRALDPLDADPGGAERGQIVHAALDEFVRRGPTSCRADPGTELLRHRRAPFRAGSPPSRRWRPCGGRASCGSPPGSPRSRRTRRERRRGWRRSRGRASSFAAPGGPFRLRARADRIEIGRDGRLTIVDYKTGPVPRSQGGAARACRRSSRSRP